MKAALALALSGFQGLGSDDYRERAVDRLGAAGSVRNAGALEGCRREIDEQVRVSHHAELEAHLNSLGVDLIAFKFGGRVRSRADAEDRLAGILSWPAKDGGFKLALTSRQRDRVARWAVQEWTDDTCSQCKGAKESPDHERAGLEGPQRMKACPTCAGTGRRRYSDEERRAAMGEEFRKAMYEAHGIIGRAESMALRTAAGMLERWK